MHSFTVIAPTEWNKLPQAIITMESITGFRKQLKDLPIQISLSSTIAYLPYQMLTWILTSFWNWITPFWISAP